jgi:hypothetical protein
LRDGNRRTPDLVTSELKPRGGGRGTILSNQFGDSGLFTSSLVSLYIGGLLRRRGRLLEIELFRVCRTLQLTARGNMLCGLRSGKLRLWSMGGAGGVGVGRSDIRGTLCSRLGRSPVVIEF